ncbi:MAG: hypothetical protein ACLFVK_03795 [Dehalococcoidia bacterium]
MKKLIFVSVIIIALLASASVAVAKGNGNGISNGKDEECTTIQDGSLTYSEGHYLEDEPLEIGYDPYWYNYQAHMFNGYYANVYLGHDGYPPYEGDDEAYFERLVEEGYAENVEKAEEIMEGKWYWPNRDIDLLMKWNDAWLSNKDCDGDGKLDRHYGYDSYIGSGAWLTNHMRGGQGKDHWTYFTKIVAVPEDAVLEDGVWYTADGTEIGPSIWGQFAQIQTAESGEGATYISPAGPGFGKW